MKNFILIFLLSGGLVIASCAPKSNLPVIPAAIPSASPRPATVWQIIRTMSYSHPVNYGGFLDDFFGMTVGYGGIIYYTTDGGANWLQAQNMSLCRFGLDIVNSQVAWNCGNGGHVRVSTDSGKTWQAVTNFGSSEPTHCRFLSFLDATTGWAVAPSLLGMTTDGGQTWKEVTLPEGIQHIAAISLRTASDGYLLDSSSRLFITADGGQTWTSQQLDFASDAFLAKSYSPTSTMRFTDERHGMIVLLAGTPDAGYQATSAYTTDGGKTWQIDPLPVEKGKPNLYLSHDGQTLTVLDQLSKTMTILRFQKP